MKSTGEKELLSDSGAVSRENVVVSELSFADIVVAPQVAGVSGRDVCLQPLTGEDLGFVRDTYNYYIQHSTAIFYLYPLTDDEVKRAVPVGDDRYKSFLIKVNGETCGFCYFSRFKPKEAFDITVEITLYLLPSYGGKGIGYEAMQLFEPYIRAAGFGNIIALITGENTPSIRLFTKCGYSECGFVREVAQKFGRRLDLAMYQKLIR